jgi:hypothetical protein
MWRGKGGLESVAWRWKWCSWRWKTSGGERRGGLRTEGNAISPPAKTEPGSQFLFDTRCSCEKNVLSGASTVWVDISLFRDE